MVAPYVSQAGVTYPVAVDTENRLGKLFGFTMVPNGIMVNPAGTITFIREGDFNVAREDQRRLLADLIAGRRESVPTWTPRRSYLLTPQQEARVATLYARGFALLRAGEAAAALRTWREALLLDPDNFIIRKQCWYLEYPEKFQPEIDFDWQRQQLARERRAERQLLAKREHSPGQAGS